MERWGGEREREKLIFSIIIPFKRNFYFQAFAPGLNIIQESYSHLRWQITIFEETESIAKTECLNTSEQKGALWHSNSVSCCPCKA